MPATPKTLGRYEIVDRLGDWTWGAVYLTRDPMLDRPAVIKTFRAPEFLDSDAATQRRLLFLSEARAAGMLCHPNIVMIYDVFEEGGSGLAIIAMEFVQGRSLERTLRDRQLELQEIVGIITQVAEGLDHAHRQNVIHRDVKPANILIAADDRVKVADCGIAHLGYDSTQSEAVIGTPNYMAPEQVRGSRIDGRIDVFALGVVLYEMLTRRLPFGRHDTLTSLVYHLLHKPFMPAQTHRKDLPPSIDVVLGKALEKDPARRYQRAGDLAEDLRAAVAEREHPPDGVAAFDVSTERTHRKDLPPSIDVVLGKAPREDPARRYQRAGDLAEDLRAALAEREHTPDSVAAFDVFICHASEDKAGFVEALARRLSEHNLRVWYDSFRLKLGDRLRPAIDEGLARSRFGIVVLSPSFCRKEWPQRELEGLLALERGGRKVILPLWHGVSHEEVTRFSPILADRVALTSRVPLEQIVTEILAVVRE